MNKIKLMYDVVRKMKDKEALKGSLKVQAKKNDIKVFGFENDFEKDFSRGQGKARFATELDYNGKKFKHESSTEFNMGEGHGHPHHKFMGHLHGHMHGRLHEHMHGSHGSGCMKEKLNRIAFMLSIFNAVKVEEKEDKSFMLTLNSVDIPEDLKKELHESIRKHHEQMKSMHAEKHPMFNTEEHQCMMKELHSMEEHNLDLSICISQSCEIEKVLVRISGKQKGEQGEVNNINLEAELTLQ